MSSQLVPPLAAPSLNIPPASSTVDVRIIKSATLEIVADIFWRPQTKGLDRIDVPVFCFLISHGAQHILFDLGIRQDWENSAPITVKSVQSVSTKISARNIADILDSPANTTSIKSTSLSALVWSHHHFDHIGDTSTFPSSIPLIVGPGTKAQIQPGYPTSKSALLLDSDTADREVRELDFQSPSSLKIGRFRAIDYFADGSFYLLDAPGHCPGHLWALARTTSGPESSFVFMGADAAHHAGLLRPSPYLPLLDSITLPHTDTTMSGKALQALRPRNNSATSPFFEPSERMFPAYEAAQETIEGIQGFDVTENVFVVLAHDASLVGEVEMLPKKVNGWMASEVKERTKWALLRDFKEELG